MSCDYRRRLLLRAIIGDSHLPPGWDERAVMEALDILYAAYRHRPSHEESSLAPDHEINSVFHQYNVDPPDHGIAPAGRRALLDVVRLAQDLVSDGVEREQALTILRPLVERAASPPAAPAVITSAHDRREVARQVRESFERLWESDRPFGLGRDEVEQRAAQGDPVAEMALTLPPRKAPDGTIIAHLVETNPVVRIPDEARRDLAEMLRGFVPKPNRAFASTEAVNAALSIIRRNLMAWDRLVQEGAVSPDGITPAAKPSGGLAASLVSYGLYGPPGVGKSALMIQLAAYLPFRHPRTGEIRYGVPFAAFEVNPHAMGLGEDLGRASIGSNGELTFQVGRVALVGACGGVVGIEEVLRDYRVGTILQRAMELDGIGRRMFGVSSAEAGIPGIPIHRDTIIYTSGNPGYEGDPQHPPGAMWSRQISIRFPPATPADLQAMIRANARLLSTSGQVEDRHVETIQRISQQINEMIRNAAPGWPILTPRELAAAAASLADGERDAAMMILLSRVPDDLVDPVQAMMSTLFVGISPGRR